MSYSQKNNPNPELFKKADAHIQLANKHIDELGDSELCNNSFLYGAARFNAWISAAGLKDVEEMKMKRQDLINYFVEQYTDMLSENLDDYIANYDLYLGNKNSNT